MPVGTVLARIREAGVNESPAVLPPTIIPPAAPAPAGAREGSPHHARVSPMARRLAEELRIDLATVTGTGPQGAITRDDVQRAATYTEKPPESARPEKPREPAKPSRPPQPSSASMGASAAMRAAIAAAMARSKREIPHYYLSTTIDMSSAMAWLRTENERRPVTERLLPAALLVKAVALALREVPELNGHWSDGAFRAAPGVHVGCAISLRGGGLVAPALHDTDSLDLAKLMRQLQDLVTRARAGSLKSSELADATITVTNLGEQGAESAFGIIYPPQVALVGFGRISERPWVNGERVEARPLVTATLSGDHRATDGHRGGVFLAVVDRLLQVPEKL